MASPTEPVASGKISSPAALPNSLGCHHAKTGTSEQNCTPSPEQSPEPAEGPTKEHDGNYKVVIWPPRIPLWHILLQSNQCEGWEDQQRGRLCSRQPQANLKPFSVRQCLSLSVPARICKFDVQPSRLCASTDDPSFSKTHSQRSRSQGAVSMALVAPCTCTVQKHNKQVVKNSIQILRPLLTRGKR